MLTPKQCGGIITAHHLGNSNREIAKVIKYDYKTVENILKYYFNELCKAWEKEEGQKMHPRMMTCVLHKIGFISYIAYTIPFCKDSHIIARYNWCKEHKDWVVKCIWRKVGKRLDPFCFAPVAKNAFSKDGIYQHDGASVYTSKVTIKFLDRKNIRIFSWLTKSPDLNPIENL
ncbi:14815_t:CDS:2 [Dentiscutata heterogama]|uniref:14815_t:CDS:1 n=1 Tax=Dentiscutata heterogama TaxID=1316150 RepID=A0ACA9KT93_9GLOM|nr:14815_t:CDS:2 [Dentiscutata heterogama]